MKKKGRNRPGWKQELRAALREGAKDLTAPSRRPIAQAHAAVRAAEHRMTAQRKPVPRIEIRGGIPIVVMRVGCRPATPFEWWLWRKLTRVQQELRKSNAPGAGGA